MFTTDLGLELIIFNSVFLIILRHKRSLMGILWRVQLRAFLTLLTLLSILRNNQESIKPLRQVC